MTKTAMNETSTSTARARDTRRDGLRNKIESFLLTRSRPFWQTLGPSVPGLRAMVYRWRCYNKHGGSPPHNNQPSDDLSQIYGLNDDFQKALRLHSEENGWKGRLLSEFRDKEEWAPRLFGAEGSEIRALPMCQLEQHEMIPVHT